MLDSSLDANGILSTASDFYSSLDRKDLKGLNLNPFFFRLATISSLRSMSSKATNGQKFAQSLEHVDVVMQGIDKSLSVAEEKLKKGEKLLIPGRNKQHFQKKGEPAINPTDEIQYTFQEKDIKYGVADLNPQPRPTVGEDFKGDFKDHDRYALWQISQKYLNAKLEQLCKKYPNQVRIDAINTLRDDENILFGTNINDLSADGNLELQQLPSENDSLYQANGDALITRLSKLLEEQNVNSANPGESQNITEFAKKKVIPVVTTIQGIDQANNAQQALIVSKNHEKRQRLLRFYAKFLQQLESSVIKKVVDDYNKNGRVNESTESWDEWRWLHYAKMYGNRGIDLQDVSNHFNHANINNFLNRSFADFCNSQEKDSDNPNQSSITPEEKQELMGMLQASFGVNLSVAPKRSILRKMWIAFANFWLLMAVYCKFQFLQLRKFDPNNEKETLSNFFNPEKYPQGHQSAKKLLKNLNEGGFYTQLTLVRAFCILFAPGYVLDVMFCGKIKETNSKGYKDYVINPNNTLHKILSHPITTGLTTVLSIAIFTWLVFSSPYLLLLIAILPTLSLFGIMLKPISLFFKGLYENSKSIVRGNFKDQGQRFYQPFEADHSLLKGLVQKTEYDLLHGQHNVCPVGNLNKNSTEKVQLIEALRDKYGKYIYFIPDDHNGMMPYIDVSDEISFLTKFVCGIKNAFSSPKEVKSFSEKCATVQALDRSFNSMLHQNLQAKIDKNSPSKESSKNKNTPGKQSPELSSNNNDHKKSAQQQTSEKNSRRPARPPAPKNRTHHRKGEEQSPEFSSSDDSDQEKSSQKTSAENSRRPARPPAPKNRTHRHKREEQSKFQQYLSSSDENDRDSRGSRGGRSI